MTLVRIDSLFDVSYGTNLELVNLQPSDPDDIRSIPFVSRTEKRNGISGHVVKEEGIIPNNSMTISVAGGGSVLSTFLQKEEYYSGRDVYILSPLKPFSEAELLFYVFTIRQNKYKFNYGRQANKTLGSLLIPATPPKEWSDILPSQYFLSSKSVNNNKLNLDTSKWKIFPLTDYFHISASSDELSDLLTPGGNTPYVTSSDSNNGITSYIKELPSNSAGTITANRGGSVGYFYYQPFPYQATPVDVRILTPKFAINPFIGLFLKTVLQLEKYRFNYSRKMGSDRLAEFLIALPCDPKGEPDWLWMEGYIKSLPYSTHINR